MEENRFKTNTQPRTQALRRLIFPLYQAASARSEK